MTLDHDDDRHHSQRRDGHGFVIRSLYWVSTSVWCFYVAVADICSLYLPLFALLETAYSFIQHRLKGQSTSPSRVQHITLIEPLHYFSRFVSLMKPSTSPTTSLTLYKTLRSPSFRRFSLLCIAVKGSRNTHHKDKSFRPTSVMTRTTVMARRLPYLLRLSWPLYPL